MITKLYYFIKVAQVGNLTRAADELFISQPALSMAIKRLEKDLNVSLFNREGNRLTLSFAGEKLLPFAETLYSDYIRLKSALSFNNSSQCIRLGSGISHVAEIIEHYMEKVYDGSIVLQQYFDYYSLHSALLEHKVDITFCTPPIFGKDIISRNIFIEPICALMNASHPLAKSESPIGLNDLISYPLITLPKDFPMRVAIDRAFAEANIKPQYSIEIDSIVISSLLKQEHSRLVTLYPLSRARKMYNSGSLEYRPINSKYFKRIISISWTSSASASLILEDILNSTEKYYSSSPFFQKWGSFPQEEKIDFTLENL